MHTEGIDLKKAFPISSIGDIMDILLLQREQDLISCKRNKYSILLQILL